MSSECVIGHSTVALILALSKWGQWVFLALIKLLEWICWWMWTNMADNKNTHIQQYAFQTAREWTYSYNIKWGCTPECSDVLCKCLCEAVEKKVDFA